MGPPSGKSWSLGVVRNGRTSDQITWCLFFSPPRLSKPPSGSIGTSSPGARCPWKHGGQQSGKRGAFGDKGVVRGKASGVLDDGERAFGVRTVVLMAAALLGGCQGESVGSVGSNMPVLSCLVSFLILFSLVVSHTICGANVGAIWVSFWSSFLIQKAYQNQALILHLFRSLLGISFGTNLETCW